MQYGLGTRTLFAPRQQTPFGPRTQHLGAPIWSKQGCTQTSPYFQSCIRPLDTLSGSCNTQKGRRGRLRGGRFSQRDASLLVQETMGRGLRLPPTRTPESPGLVASEPAVCTRLAL